MSKLVQLILSWWKEHEFDTAGDHNIYSDDPDFVTEALNLEKEYQWTQEPPTEPGWYWNYDTYLKLSKPMEVIHRVGIGFVVISGCAEERLMNHTFSGDWWQKMVVPALPEEVKSETST